MLKHFLTLAIRHFTRNKGYTLINLAGLVMGLTAVLLASAFIADETGYDRFHAKADRIFRVNKRVAEPSGARLPTAESPGRMAETLVADYPEVEAACHVAPWFDDVLLTREDRALVTEGFVFADGNLFELFDLDLLRGDPGNVLSRPGQILLTPALAQALFGDEDPVGKSLVGLQDQRYTVSGIIQEPPRRSHLRYEALASWASTRPESGFHDFPFLNNWLGQTVYTYVLLDDPAKKTALEDKLPAFTARYMANRTDSYDFYLQPLTEVYLHSQDLRYLRGNQYGSATFLRTFSLIAFFILVVACFNYINISTAKSLGRAREIGVKKVLGAGRRELRRQFLAETGVIMLVAALLSWVLATHLLPPFNDLFQRDIPGSMLFDPVLLVLFLVVGVLTTLAAGFFPGIVLSRFRPASVLDGMGMPGTGMGRARPMLTGIQLAVCMALIAGTLLLNRQFRYMINSELGFDKDEVLVMQAPPGIQDQAGPFRQELLKIPGVVEVATCQAAIGSGTFGTTVIPEGQEEEMAVQLFRVDSHFMRTYGMELHAGRGFSARFPADTSGSAVIVNEAFVRQMGWEDPLQRSLRFDPESEPATIVGVVSDFHFNSFHDAITPLVMYPDRRRTNVSVRFEPREAATLVPALASTWKAFESRYPFDYYFVDEMFARQYGAERLMVQLVTFFSALAVIIACLGLYGLATFTVSRRIKEIGIRKVLGAGTGSILFMLHRGLFRQAAIAFFISVPVAWLVMRDWLAQYPYRVDLAWWMFALAGLITLTVALVAVLGQSWHAARRNPVEALRYE